MVIYMLVIKIMVYQIIYSDDEKLLDTIENESSNLFIKSWCSCNLKLQYQ